MQYTHTRTHTHDKLSALAPYLQAHICGLSIWSFHSQAASTTSLTTAGRKWNSGYLDKPGEPQSSESELSSLDPKAATPQLTHWTTRPIWYQKQPCNLVSDIHFPVCHFQPYMDLEGTSGTFWHHVTLGATCDDLLSVQTSRKLTLLPSSQLEQTTRNYKTLSWTSVLG